VRLKNEDVGADIEAAAGRRRPPARQTAAAAAAADYLGGSANVVANANAADVGIVGRMQLHASIVIVFVKLN